MLSTTRSLTAIAIAAAAAAAAAAPAAALTPINAGHVDVLDVDYAAGALSLDLRNETVSPINDDVDPSTVEVHALPGSQTTVPNKAGYGFLGTPGSPLWLLPQQANASLVWPGWNTQDVAAGIFAGDAVSLTLVSATGPGQFAIYTVPSVGSPTVKANTADGLPDTFSIPRGTHAHANWAFKATGTYSLTFKATGTAGGVLKDSGLKTYTFVVGS